MNRTLFYTLGLTLAVATLASCAKDDLESPAAAGSGEVTFEVYTSDATRVGVDGLEVYWQEGDQMLFYNSSSHPNTAASFTTLTVSDIITNEDGTPDGAKFSGSLSALSGGTVSGFYPVNGYTNVTTGTTAAMSFSSMRILQPAYLQYTYSDGEPTPASVGQYCYLHVVSDEAYSTNVSNMTGSVKHLMSYLDFNFTNLKDEVQRVYISMETPLYYPSMKVSSDGVVTKDHLLDYVGSAAGDGTYQIEMDYIVVELTDEATGKLGVFSNSEGVLSVRVPVIPQLPYGKWNLFVCYENGSEDIYPVAMSSTVLSAGSVYGMGDQIDLDYATFQKTATPKLGDYYYSDDTYSTALDSTKTPVGMVYELTGTVADTKISKIFSLNIFKQMFVNNEYLGGTATVSNTICGASIVSNENGLMDIDKIVSITKTQDAAIALGVSESSTIMEVCEKVFPAYYSALSLNGDMDWDSFSGDEVGLWYLQSMEESWRFVLNTSKVQTHNVIYMNERMKDLPTSITKGGTAGVETLIDSATGLYFNLVVPGVTTTSYQYRSSSAAANGGNYYLRQRNLHSIYSGAYIQQQPYNVVNGTQALRPIKRVN